MRIHLARTFAPLALTIATPALAAALPQGVPELYEDMGTTAVLMGGGTAHVYDLSAIDANPAGLALGQTQPTFLATGEVRWRNSNIRILEGGFLDTTTSELAGAVKARRTTLVTGRRMDRFTAGLAERAGDSPFIFGLGADLDQNENPKSAVDKKNVWRLRSGIIYQASLNLFIGARTSGWFDDSKRPREHAAGVSWNAGDVAFLNVDALFGDKKLTRYAFGATLLPKPWLDLLIGYGYEIEAQRHGGAASIAVKSEKFRLYYSLVKPELRGSELRHSVGATVNLLALDKK